VLGDSRGGSMLARLTTGLERLYEDVEAAAELAGASCIRETTWGLLKAYRKFFMTSAVSFRTSTRAPEKRGLNVRYVELDTPEDPHPIARAEGFLSRTGHPLDDLLPEIQRQFPILGYGLDFGVSYGLEKIWAFFPHRPQPIEKVRSLPSIPESVWAHARYFARFGLNDLSLFALDYRNRTVNLYFMRAPGSFSTGRLAELIGELGFEVPGEELLQHCTRSVPIYFTFTWDSPRVERLCFGVITSGPGQVPTHFHPLIERYTAGVPFATESRKFIYSVTLSRGEAFIKIENDYNGAMTPLMRVF